MSKNKSYYYLYPAIHIGDGIANGNKLVKFIRNTVFINGELKVFFDRYFNDELIDEDLLIDSYLSAESIADIIIGDDIVVKVSPGHKYDKLINRFINGEYSKIQSAHKKSILTFTRNFRGDSDLIRVSGVLMKSSNYRKVLAERLDVEEEMFDELESIPNEKE